MRPAVIIQNDIGNKYSPTVIVALITSQCKPNLPTHVKVCEKDRLCQTSIIMAEQIRTIDKCRVKEYLCHLCDETMKKLSVALQISVEIKNEEKKGESKMAELVTINSHDLVAKEYNGKRVVTFKDIDMVHERPDGTARVTFNSHKDRFVENEDYFVCDAYEARKLFGIVAPNGMTLMTEQGYLMLVKPFGDDLAWEVQRKLVKTYFNKKRELSVREIMREQLGMLDEHESRISKNEERISKLEGTMNIDYGQQRILEKEVAKTVIDCLGGKESPAYKEMGKKVFAECNHDVKDYFRVNSRNNIPMLRYEDAVEYIRSWQPCTNTKVRIRETNERII